MSQLGIGAMIHHLSGGSEQSASKYYGRKITYAMIADNRLDLRFEDGAKIAIWDNGQSCCENRYMSTDDDVDSLVGNSLRRIEAKDGPTTEEHGEPHEMAFIEIGTDQNFITVVTHNEHNGYYGGFGLTITEEEAAAGGGAA